MKRPLFIMLLLLFVSFDSFSTTVVGKTFEFGRVKVQIVTSSYSYAEIQKAAIAGKYCCDYLNKYDHADTFKVFIRFYHRPDDENFDPIYLLGFNKGVECHYMYNPVKMEQNLESDGLVIIDITKEIVIKDLIKILDYGVKNHEEIFQEQKDFFWEKTKWQSIDTCIVNSIAKKNNRSKKINRTISQEVKFESDSSEVAFSFRRGIYSFYKKKDPRYKPSLKLDNIAQIYFVDSTHVVVFDTHTSFYYINIADGLVSKKIKLNNIAGYAGSYYIFQDSNNLYLGYADSDTLNAVVLNLDTYLLETVMFFSWQKWHHLYDKQQGPNSMSCYHIIN